MSVNISSLGITETVDMIDNTIVMIDAGRTGVSPISWIEQRKEILEQILQQYGGILLRNFDIHSVSEFNQVANLVSPKLLDYIYRSTPRTKLGGKIYTATEYPANRHIPLHNEFSYFRSWPQKILFYCVIPPAEGGETPIADGRKVLKRIDKTIIEKFQEKKIMYLRNYTDGIDLSWQEVFQATTKEEVEKFCLDNGIDFEWKLKPNLTTKQVCQATTIHPVTHEKVWFNQAHLFHVSSLDPESRALLKGELGENNLTRNSFYGDGSEIDPEELEHIRQAYNAESIKFNWQRGDVMILDNVLMAHGRSPFKGERKIAVAMG